MSALPPKADMCGAARDVRFGPIADIMCLFDHFVSGGRQCWWKSESERFGRFGVDDECELRWILHWQVGGVGAIKDAINVGGCERIWARRSGPFEINPPSRAKTPLS
jgi:hypothetical protein